MADPVIIDGFSDDALANLPAWAKEDTLADILQVLKSTMSMQDNHFKNLEAALKSFTGVKSSSGGQEEQDPKLIGQVNDELKKHLKFAKDEADQEKREKKDWDKKNKRNATDEKQYGALSKKALAFDAALLALDYITEKGIEMIKLNVKVYTDLYNAGVNLVDLSSGITDGFQSLGHVVALSGIRLNDLNNILSKYSTTVTVFGTQKVVKASNLAYKSLSALGFSATEGLEFTASYLNAVKGFTNIQNLSAQEVADQASKFGASMRTISLLTGQSTEELMKKFDALAKSTDAFVLTSQVGADASKNLLAFTSSLKDQNLAKQLLGTITAPIKQTDEVVNALLASGQGRIAQQYMEVSQRIKAAAAAGASPEEQAEMLRQFAASVHLTSAEIQNLQLQNTAASKATVSFVNSMNQYSRDTAPLTAQKKKEIEQANKSAQASKRITDAWNRITSAIERMFAPTAGLLEFFGDAVTKVADVVDWVADKLEGTGIPIIATVIGSLVSFGMTLVRGARLITNIFGGAPKWLSTLGETILAPFRWVGRSIIDIFSKSGQAIGKVTQYFSEIFESVLKSFSSVGTRIWEFISGFFKSSSEGIIARILGWLGKLGSVFEPFIGWLTSLGGIFMRLIGVVGWLISAFEVGYQIGTWLYNLISDFSWFQKSIDAIFGFMDHLLQYLPGEIGNDAKERLENRQKEEDKKRNVSGKVTEKKETPAETKKAVAQGTAEGAKASATQVAAVQESKNKPEVKTAIPTDPKPTAVTSVSANQPTTTDNSSATQDTKSTEMAAPTAPTPVTKESEVNNILKYQSMLLEQMLNKQSELLSTTRDMLKATRNN
jgi:hypothetical protein